MDCYQLKKEGNNDICYNGWNLENTIQERSLPTKDHILYDSRIKKLQNIKLDVKDYECCV